MLLQEDTTAGFLRGLLFTESCTDWGRALYIPAERNFPPEGT